MITTLINSLIQTKVNVDIFMDAKMITDGDMMISNFLKKEEKVSFREAARKGIRIPKIAAEIRQRYESHA